MMGNGMVFVGVDGGLSGGISVLDAQGDILFLWCMPIIKGKRRDYDVQGIRDKFVFLVEQGYVLNVFLEKALVLPVSGRLSVSSTSWCNGFFQGLCSGLGVSFEVVSPKVWQKRLFGVQEHVEAKASSIRFVQRKFPMQDFRASERALKVSDGLADATCLAFYGFLQGR